MTFARELDSLGASTQHLLHTVAGLDDERWRAPSLLPGWSRAHVVAHLALNAEGIAGAVDALLEGGDRAIYASNEGRDADIEELAGGPMPQVRERLEQACAGISTSLSALTPDLMSAGVARVPDGPRWPVSGLPATRRNEVEIHHADLGAGYTHEQWPVDFSTGVLERMTTDRAGHGPFTIEARDLARHWDVGGPGGPVVSGRAGDLAWWLLGRGGEDRLECESGGLPTLGAWR